MRRKSCAAERAPTLSVRRRRITQGHDLPPTEAGSPKSTHDTMTALSIHAAPQATLSLSAQGQDADRAPELPLTSIATVRTSRIRPTPHNLRVHARPLYPCDPRFNCPFNMLPPASVASLEAPSSCHDKYSHGRQRNHEGVTQSSMMALGQNCSSHDSPARMCSIWDPDNTINNHLPL